MCTSSDSFFCHFRVSSTSRAATLAWLSSVYLPLHAACHPNSTECLWHCHLDVMSYFFPVTQHCRLSTGPAWHAAAPTLPNALQRQQDSIFKIRGIKSGQSALLIATVLILIYYVSGRNGKPATESGRDSPGGNL